jgi:hypothetical protein
MRAMPSRHNFAIFRLIAYLRLRGVRLSGEADRVLFVDRHQSAYESYSVGVWLLLTLTCYLAALMNRIALPLALAIALPVAWIVLQADMVLTGLAIAPLVRVIARKPGQNNIQINSFLVMLQMFAAAAYFATRPTWVRFAAWQFLAVAALNAVAAALVFLLSGAIARLESSLGGESSASSSLPSR